MKHFILSTILTVFISLSIFGQSDLVVYSNDGVKFTLEVNGVQQNAEPTTNVKVEGITQEFISVRMLFTAANIPPLKKSFTLVNNKETSAMLFLNKKGQYKLRYMGENPIKKETAANQSVIRYGEEPVALTNEVNASAPATQESTTTTTVTTTTVNDDAPTSSESVSMNVKIGGQNIGISTSMTGMDASTSTTVTETTTVTSSSSSTVSNSSSGTISAPAETVTSSGGCDAPMPSGDFSSALNSIESKSFEDSKVTLAKQFTKANCLSADQVKQVMKKFTYEESKLDYAKFAYEYCLDQGNYYKVNDAFDFELTIDELNEFIEAQ